MNQGHVGVLIAIGMLVLGLAAAVRALPGMSSREGRGMPGHLLFGCAFWLVGALFHLYKRGYVVFGEFASGVHDWPSYRTSMFKYLGAFTAFLAFNGFLGGVLLTPLVLIAGRQSTPGTDTPSVAVAVLIHWAAAAILLLSARFFLRRMP